MEEKILTTEELMKYCHFYKKEGLCPKEELFNSPIEDAYRYWMGEKWAVTSNKKPEERKSILGTFKNVGEPGMKLAPHLPKILVAGLFMASMKGSDFGLDVNAEAFEKYWFPDYIASTKMYKNSVPK